MDISVIVAIITTAGGIAAAVLPVYIHLNKNQKRVAKAVGAGADSIAAMAERNLLLAQQILESNAVQDHRISKLESYHSNILHEVQGLKHRFEIVEKAYTMGDGHDQR